MRKLPVMGILQSQKILQIFVSHINNCIYLQLFLKNGSYNIKLKIKHYVLDT